MATTPRFEDIPQEKLEDGDLTLETKVESEIFENGSERKNSFTLPKVVTISGLIVGLSIGTLFGITGSIVGGAIGALYGHYLESKDV